MKVFGADGAGDHPFAGLVKVRLVHAYGCSLIVPDQVFLEEPTVWFQPETFLPNVLQQLDKQTICTLRCDLGSDSIEIEFRDDDIVDSLRDCSYLYRCEIRAAEQLADLASGTWKMIEGRPYLHLFHHTHMKAHRSIVETQEFRPSHWNIQGNRKLTNVGYVYFSYLETIRNRADLMALAMSPDRVLHYLRDGASSPPNTLPSDWKSTAIANDVLEVKAYWSDPEIRDHTVQLGVDSTLLSPHHVWRHDTETVWYEVVCPAILRVGVEYGETVAIRDGVFVPGQAFKLFDYMVIGDARTLDGLAAPLDEESTGAIFKIHRTESPPLEFWFNNANTDQFSSLTPEEQTFE